MTEELPVHKRRKVLANRLVRRVDPEVIRQHALHLIVRDCVGGGS